MAAPPPSSSLGFSVSTNRARSSSTPSLAFISTTTTTPRPHPYPFRPLHSSHSSPSPFLSFPSSPSRAHHRVSTAPVEQAPAPDFNFDEEISHLRALHSKLRALSTLTGKLRVLDADSRVKFFFGDGNSGSRVLSRLEPFEVFLLKCLVAAGQEHVLAFEFDWGKKAVADDGHEEVGLRRALYALGDLVEKWGLTHDDDDDGDAPGEGSIGTQMEMLKKFLKLLGEIEQFYDCIGGIIGYQIMALELLSPGKTKEETSHCSTSSSGSLNNYTDLHVPTGLNLLENTEHASQAALWGIQGLPELGEIYPLGGAGDRLGLVNHQTGECLPAALLPYCGRSLLEGLIRDLQAREFFYYKIYGRQCITPVAIMTSSVKNNHRHILELCERFDWFGRGKESFRLFEQPLVPVVACGDGKWLVTRSLDPVCKPGGHGAIWKLAYDKGIFQWFYNHGRKGATVRQVSNVVAATDLTLLALAGFGLHHKKKLGFASCERSSGATEGINVLLEKKSPNGQWVYGITCIEYTEFEKYGSLQAANFPANTNILYIDLRAAEKVGSSQNSTCLPGIVLNLKKKISYINHLGFECSASGGRLECTMQNIADNFTNKYTSRSNKSIESELDTFIVYNERKRVTSSAKKRRKTEDRSLHQTPEGSLLDVMRNAYDLLSGSKVNLPKVKDNNHYLNAAPPFLVFLHPALGPLWHVTRQKFVGGSICEGSELQVEISEFLWRDVELDGSLIILAENIMGSTIKNNNGEQILQYGTRCGRCKLQNVKVLNRGINWDSASNVYWKYEVERFESLNIILHGNAEFEAKDLVFEGNHVFEVPNGYKMCIVQDNKLGFSVKLDPIREELMESGTWFWKYIVEGTNINLEMVE